MIVQLVAARFPSAAQLVNSGCSLASHPLAASAHQVLKLQALENKKQQHCFTQNDLRGRGKRPQNKEAQKHIVG
jgi:hypothetical protein